MLVVCEPRQAMSKTAQEAVAAKSPTATNSAADSSQEADTVAVSGKKVRAA